MFNLHSKVNLNLRLNKFLGILASQSFYDHITRETSNIDSLLIEFQIDIVFLSKYNTKKVSKNHTKSRVRIGLLNELGKFTRSWHGAKRQASARAVRWQCGGVWSVVADGANEMYNDLTPSKRINYEDTGGSRPFGVARLPWTLLRVRGRSIFRTPLNVFMNGIFLHRLARIMTFLSEAVNV